MKGHGQLPWTSYQESSLIRGDVTSKLSGTREISTSVNPQGVKGHREAGGSARHQVVWEIGVGWGALAGQTALQVPYELNKRNTVQTFTTAPPHPRTRE